MSARGRFARAVVPLALLPLASCALFASHVPRERPPLHDMEEPLALATAPDDEAQRAELALGSFTGIYAGDARGSLEEMLSAPSGVLVARVVENSPADVAGVAEGDVLVSASSGGKEQELKWPSEWRAVELAASPGAPIDVVLDRAGAEVRAHITTVPRVHRADRDKVEKLREEEHVGVVLRSATEVEARAAGLGPGGGAVVIGLSLASPWRADGVVFGDLIRTAHGARVDSPQVVLDSIRAAVKDGHLELEIVRGGRAQVIDAHLTRRETETREVSIPLIFDYENDRGLHATSFLIGLVHYESSEAAWRMRLLWFISFGGGDADRLKVLSQ